MFMKKYSAILITIISVMIIVSCGGPSKDKEMAKIKELEKKKAASEKSGIINREKAAELITAYKAFADKFPKDTVSASYLFKGAQLSMNINNGKGAIEIFDRIIKDFPEHTKVPDCIFLKGFVYETQLNDLVKAKQSYQEFLKKYPKSDLADDAQASINNLGKSPDELVKEFEAKAKEDSAKTKAVVKK
jgi:outer membrane protein assembly factor BamD (BamD/ComL family)